MSIKPMLFNTDMVRALQEGRKTVTRRLVKPRYSDSVFERFKGQLCEASPLREPERLEDGRTRRFVRRYVPCKPPCKEGDVLWVRETWQFIPCIDCGLDINGICTDIPVIYEDKDSVGTGCFDYRADYPAAERICWRPSIHMPKEAARLFLRVTAVRVERLQDITEEQAVMEGIFLDSPDFIPTYHYDESECNMPGRGWNTARECFLWGVWNSTVKPADLPLYGWEANPWVWVIAFEQTERPGGWPGEEI